jgi:hypothetical protein
MMSKSLSLISLAAFLFLFSTLPAPAQTSQTERDQKAAKVKEKVLKIGSGNDTKIQVKLYSGATYQGSLTRANDADFDITDKAGVVHTVKYPDVKEIGGKNLSTGAKIAIGMGIGAGIVLVILAAIIMSND